MASNNWRSPTRNWCCTFGIESWTACAETVSETIATWLGSLHEANCITYSPSQRGLFQENSEMVGCSARCQGLRRFCMPLGRWLFPEETTNMDMLEHREQLGLALLTQVGIVSLKLVTGNLGGALAGIVFIIIGNRARITLVGHDWVAATGYCLTLTSYATIDFMANSIAFHGQSIFEIQDGFKAVHRLITPLVQWYTLSKLWSGYCKLMKLGCSSDEIDLQWYRSHLLMLSDHHLDRRELYTYEWVDDHLQEAGASEQTSQPEPMELPREPPARPQPIEPMKLQNFPPTVLRPGLVRPGSFSSSSQEQRRPITTETDSQTQSQRSERLPTSLEAEQGRRKIKGNQQPSTTLSFTTTPSHPLQPSQPLQPLQPSQQLQPLQPLQPGRVGGQAQVPENVERRRLKQNLRNLD